MKEKEVVVKINFNLRNQLKVAVLILMLFDEMNCTNQKEYCFSKLKEGPDIQGINANGACTSYLYYDNEINKRRDSEIITNREYAITNSMLLLCLQKTKEEVECSQKSEHIPHFGY